MHISSLVAEIDVFCCEPLHMLTAPVSKSTATCLSSTDSFYACAAYLAQLKYDSVILELITTGAVIAFVFRAFLGYKRLNERCVVSRGFLSDHVR